MAIQWFPGHMAKTRRLMTDNLKLVDVAIELLDARLPGASHNPLIQELLGDMPRVLLLAKADLAEEECTKAWLARFRKQGWGALACNLKGGNAKGERKAITEAVGQQAKEVLAKRQRRGISNPVIRVMVTGIPNVGKSTLINLMAGRARTETADRPGVTRGKQWIRLAQDLELLDMPGILWPNLSDKEGANKLAATGAIGENAYDPGVLALWLLAWLRQHRQGRIALRYGVDEWGKTGAVEEILSRLTKEQASLAPANKSLMLHDNDVDEEAPDLLSRAVLEAIGKKRGFLRKGGIVESEKAAVMLLDELRAGHLGRITWDDPEKRGIEDGEEIPG